MENFENVTKNTKSVAKNAQYYGLMVGFAMIVFGVILYAFDMSTNRALSFLTYVFLIAGMYIGSKKYRTSYTEGYLSYGKAFKSNFLIGLFASLLVLVWTFIFFKFIDKGIITQILEKSQEGMLESNPNLSEEELNMGMKYVKMFTTPVMMSVIGLLSNLFFSVIFGLIVAIFVKKEDSAASQDVLR